MHAQVSTPIATTSGFILPSLVGPFELNMAIVPVLSTAPTAITESPSGGETMLGGVVWYSLPIELHITIPRYAQCSAARTMTVVLPSISLYSYALFGGSNGL